MESPTNSVVDAPPSPEEWLQNAARHFLLGNRLFFPSRGLHTARRKPVWAVVRIILLALASLNLWYFGCVTVVCTVYVFTNPALTSLMITRTMQGTTVKPVRFIPYKDIPQSMRSVFIELEDHDFYEHHGISLGAIKDAMLLNRELGRTVSGGSTITQQLARNLFLSPNKNYVRKYLEAGTAILMELILGKKRILELYLNYIEFGPGIFGIGRGAQYQYRANFDDLDYEQRVRLAVIITSPLRYTVNSYYKNRGMLARYRAIMNPPTEDNFGISSPTLTPHPPAASAAGTPAPEPTTQTTTEESDNENL